MKKIVLGLFTTLLITGALVSCSSEEDELEKFKQVREALAIAEEQLENESGILLTGAASDPNIEKGLFKILLEIDHVKITSTSQLKEILESYLTKASSMVTQSYISETNWKETFHPSEIQIDELVDGKSVLIGKKTSGSNNLKMNELN